MTKCLDFKAYFEEVEVHTPVFWDKKLQFIHFIDIHDKSRPPLKKAKLSGYKHFN